MLGNLRLVDKNPTTQRDVGGRNCVGVARESTCNTGEPPPAGAIGAADMSAGWTTLTGVARIHEDHEDTAQLRLIGDLLPQVEESPGREAASLRPSSRDPIADARKVFEGYPASGALGRRHQLLTNSVIHVARESRFFAPPCSQTPLCGAGRARLKTATQPRRSGAETVDVAPGVDSAVTVGGDVDHTQIDAQHVYGRGRRRFGNINHRIQEPLATPLNEVAFPLPRAKHIPCSVGADEWNPLPSGNGPDAHHLGLPGQNPVIVGHGAQRPERPPRLPVQLVGISNFGDQANDNLSREAGCGTGSSICHPVDLELRKSGRLPGATAHVICGGIGCQQGLAEHTRLFKRRLEFDRDRQLHVSDARLRLNVSLDRCGGDPPCRGTKVTSCPERGKAPAERGELLSQDATGTPLDGPNYQMRSIGRECSQQQMHMVELDVQFQYLPRTVSGKLGNQFSHSSRYVIRQDRAPVFRAPDKVIYQQIDGVAGVRVVHAVIIQPGRYLLSEGHGVGLHAGDSFLPWLTPRDPPNRDFDEGAGSRLVNCVGAKRTRCTAKGTDVHRSIDGHASSDPFWFFHLVVPASTGSG
jgi:hypothetical protein